MNRRGVLHRPGPRRAVSVVRPGGISAACLGTTMIELLVAFAIIGIILVAAWGWQGMVTTRKLQNAAFMLEADLRWAQQAAVSNSGNGPQVELCFRPDGYDVYTTVYGGGDVLNINPSNYTVSPGTKIRSVNAGQEYDGSIQFTPPGYHRDRVLHRQRGRNGNRVPIIGPAAVYGQQRPLRRADAQRAQLLRDDSAGHGCRRGEPGLGGWGESDMRERMRIAYRGPRRSDQGGFTSMEVIVAFVIIVATLLGSVMASSQLLGAAVSGVSLGPDVETTTLGLIGKQSPGGQKTARLQTIASEWTQAQIEYARQLGYQGECDQAGCTWYLPGPASDCNGTAATGNATIIAAIGNGPALPADFANARIAVSWDANTPADNSTIPATNYLQLVEVDLYRTQTDCTNLAAYQTSYTSVSIR